jgi:hypothetical protein
VRQVQAVEQQRQLGGRQFDRDLAGRRPPVGTGHQPLGADPDAAGIEEESLDHVAAAIGKQVDIAIEWWPAEVVLDHRFQPEPPPQVGDAGGQKYASAAANRDHRANRSSLTTWPTHRASVPPWTSIEQLAER